MGKNTKRPGEGQFYRAVGETIRSYRTEAGESQAKLAKALRVATNTISRWETGTYQVSLFDLKRLAKHWAIDPVHLFVNRF